MPLPTREVKTRPLGRFQPDKFSKTIQGLGLKFHWSRAVWCTCRVNSETDQPDPNCVDCTGHGYQYVNPDEPADVGATAAGKDYVKISGILSTVTSKSKYDQTPIGMWHDGTGQLTVEAEIRVNYRDRFIAIKHEHGWKEVLTRGADTVPVGRRGRTKAIQETAMRYEAIRINWVSSRDGSGVETVYVETTDFTLVPAVFINVGLPTVEKTEPAKLTWVSGRGPDADVLYSIHYDCHPVWIVESLPYAVQASVGPARGLKGIKAPRTLPTTCDVMLDFISEAQGS